MAKWIVFAPTQNKVVVKHKGKYFRYEHRQEIDHDEQFFKEYPNIFKVIDIETPEPIKNVEVAVEEQQTNNIIENSVELNTFDDIQTSQIKPMLFVKKIAKGWYGVFDESGTKIFPEGEKKTRKAKAVLYIEENT